MSSSNRLELISLLWSEKMVNFWYLLLIRFRSFGSQIKNIKNFNFNISLSAQSLNKNFIYTSEYNYNHNCH